MVTNRVFRVRGRVVDTAYNRPLPGIHVRAYDKDPIRDDLLGHDQTDALGDFEVCFFERDYKEVVQKQPEIYVSLFDAEKAELYRTGAIRLPEGQTELYFPIGIETVRLPSGPRIISISPAEVLPGTFVEIHGDNFGSVYQDVTVEIGGREALVLSVRPQGLRVRIPPERGGLDPVVVSIAGRATTASGLLRYASPPRQGAVGTVGAPATFSGALGDGAGLSHTGTGQRVLIVMCHPSDGNAGIGGLSPAEERQRQIDCFEKLVNPGFRQMSFNRTDFDFDYTEWIELPEMDDFYFWRQADIDAAQEALDNLPADATEAERDEAEAALQVAQDSRNLMQEGLELYHDALKAAQDAGWTLTDYQGVMLCLATDHLRGQASGTWNSITDSDGDTVNLAPSTYLWIVSYTSHWGRRIHELAHAIASGDLYGATGFISDGSRWDMMGNHNQMPLFSGYNMVERLKWYRSEDDVTDPAAANVKALEWTSAPDHDEVYTLRAHDAVEDNVANSYHVIKITIFPGLTYYVEVRQEPTALPADLDTASDRPAVLQPAADAADADADQLLFDTHVEFPAAEPTHKGGVIVTKVVDDTSNLNQKIRQITLLSPTLMQAGEEVVDAARRLTVRVESKTADRPLTYSVRVTWLEVATADPAGLFDLRVRPWDSSWQTNDIWMDSEANSWNAY
ncbi:MAG: IPT/TIG domain-containing protein, partial [Vicinamibacteria bacterium]